jgi:hypothetical protein
MEINCSRFVVQRSYDAIHFTDIQTVAGNGTTSVFHSYEATDNSYAHRNEIIYYRLKQIDLDGKGNFSKTVSVKIKNANQAVIISPNPFTDFININFQSDKRKLLSIKLFNVNGKEIMSKEMDLNKGNNYFKMDHLSNLPAGNYLLQFFSEGQKMVQKTIKN